MLLIVSIVSGVLSQLVNIAFPIVNILGEEKFLGVIFSLCLVILLMLVGLVLDYSLFRSKSIRFLELINSFISSFLKSYSNINDFIRKQNPSTNVTWGDINKLFSYFFGAIMDVSRKSFNLYLKELHSSPEERRKKELMEKASKNEITYEEAKELRRLLEKQRKEREEAGDIIGAILIGMALLFVLWLITQLFREEKR